MEVVIAPDARLKIKTRPVKNIATLLASIKQMVRLTKKYVDPEGVGLAATQIGQTEQFFVMKNPDGTFKAVFNPQIIAQSSRTKFFFEGCLSIPNYYAEIRRPIAVTVTYLNSQGQFVKERLTGVSAWIFQHEYDHLQGILFMDRALEQKSRLFKVTGRDRAGAEVFEEVTL